MEINLIIILLLALSAIQSILGVGILVIGTPILLLLDYNLPKILELLLPVSIITSLLTFLIIINKKKIVYKKIDTKINFYFFSICLPAIFLGLFLLEIFSEKFNFKLIVSIIIFSSLIIKYYFQKRIELIPKFVKKILMFLIGIIHGFTNSGGTILSLFFSNTNKDTITVARLNITYFYLLLAFFQFIIFLFFFETEFSFDKLLKFFLIALFGSLLGSILVKFISEKLFKYTIEFLAIFSAIFLLFK